MLVELGQIVDVYWNSTRKLYSLRVNGLVVHRAKMVELADVSFHVSEAGRQRVLQTGVKNVHAVVRGRLRAVSDLSDVDLDEYFVYGEPLYYRPQLSPHFSSLHDDTPYGGCRRLGMTTQTKIFSRKAGVFPCLYAIDGRAIA